MKGKNWLDDTHINAYKYEGTHAYNQLNVHTTRRSRRQTRQRRHTYTQHNISREGTNAQIPTYTYKHIHPHNRKKNKITHADIPATYKHTPTHNRDDTHSHTFPHMFRERQNDEKEGERAFPKKARETMNDAPQPMMTDEERSIQSALSSRREIGLIVSRPGAILHTLRGGRAEMESYLHI